MFAGDSLKLVHWGKTRTTVGWITSDRGVTYQFVGQRYDATKPRLLRELDRWAGRCEALRCGAAAR